MLGNRNTVLEMNAFDGLTGRLDVTKDSVSWKSMPTETSYMEKQREKKNEKKRESRLSKHCGTILKV